MLVISFDYILYQLNLVNILSTKNDLPFEQFAYESVLPHVLGLLVFSFFLEDIANW